MEPLVKWLGGKRQLLDILTERMPASYKTYYEPFLGGGALYLAVEPHRAVLGDWNRSLIHMYRAVQCDPDEVSDLLSRYRTEYDSLPDMEQKDAYYFARRAEYNEYLLGHKLIQTEEAALLIFLNKAGFNGVYRVNSKGEYNVPSGHRMTVSVPTREELKRLSSLLFYADIDCRDFAETVQDAQAGDFVFFDSPYHETFDKYQRSGFSEEEHRRLARLFADLSDRGVQCMLTNSDTAFIRELYQDYHMEQVDVYRAVNRNGNARTGVELVVRNYL